MPDRSPSTHAAALAEIIRHCIRLKSRFRRVLPDDDELTAIVARLAGSHPQGKAASAADFGLLYHVCIVLSGNPEAITMGELSQALDVPLSTATRIVDWLVKSGYAARLSDPKDRRVVRITLTAMGQAMYQAGDKFIQNRVEALLQPFTAAERENLVMLADKLIRTFENDT